jgi:cytochrome b561
MTLHNSSDGYGTLTKTLHWLVVALFAFQFAVANIMLRMDESGTVLGLSRDMYYNWHKSIGLVALAVAVVRLLARRSGQLPDWAPVLSERERRFIHRAEQVLYIAMFVMPVSGFLYVMAGGYGVTLFGMWELPKSDRHAARDRDCREGDAYRERLRARSDAGRSCGAGAVAYARAEGRSHRTDAAAAQGVRISAHLRDGRRIAP